MRWVAQSARPTPRRIMPGGVCLDESGLADASQRSCTGQHDAEEENGLEGVKGPHVDNLCLSPPLNQNTAALLKICDVYRPLGVLWTTVRPSRAMLHV